MQKSLSRILDISKPYDVSNDITICRGDNVQLAFTFKDGDDSFDISSATKARLYAKRINEKGFVNPDESPLFAKEITLPQNTDTVSFNIPTTSTSGNAGEYLLVCILLSSDDNIITAQSMPLTLFENGYTGVYTPDEDFRDEVLDALSQAQQAATTATTKADEATAIYQQGLTLYNQGIEQATEILSACNTAKTETQTLKSECQSLKETTASLATQTAQNTTTCSALKTQTESARDQAIAAKNQAQEIVDPDNRIGQLFQTKLDKGVLYCNGGYAKVSQGAFTSLSKCSMLVRFARANTTRTTEEYICNVGDGGTVNTGISVRLLTDNRISVLFQFKKSDGTAAGTAISAFDGSGYLDGKMHSLAVCWSGTSAKIYIDGVLKGSTSSIPSGAAIVSSNIGITLAGRGATSSLFFRGQVSDFAVLNYDASEVDSNGNYTSAYSIADYQNGRAIPPAMRPFSEVLGRNTTWSAMDNAPVDISVSGDVITITTTAEISDAYFRIKPAATINGHAGQTLRASIDSISGIGGNGLGVKPMQGTGEINQLNLTNNTKSGSIYNTSAFDSFNLTIRYGSSPIPSGTVFTITGFRAWVNGAIVALENYTFKNKIRDTSGNGNTATVSGVLAGDRDESIAQMYEAFSYQYKQENP